MRFLGCQEWLSACLLGGNRRKWLEAAGYFLPLIFVNNWGFSMVLSIIAFISIQKVTWL